MPQDSLLRVKGSDPLSGNFGNWWLGLGAAKHWQRERLIVNRYQSPPPPASIVCFCLPLKDRHHICIYICICICIHIHICICDCICTCFCICTDSKWIPIPCCLFVCLCLPSEDCHQITPLMHALLVAICLLHATQNVWLALEYRICGSWFE